MSSGLKGGRKLARSAKKKSYYTNQFIRTEQNKRRRAARVARRAALWDTALR
jgi:hypothetical protein